MKARTWKGGRYDTELIWQDGETTRNEKEKTFAPDGLGRKEEVEIENAT